MMQFDRFSELKVNLVLSWVAGYIDTAGFLGLNGLFTAHVTGNLVVAGAKLAGTEARDVWVRLAVVPVFVAAVAITTALTRSRHASLSFFLWLEAFSLMLFAAAGIATVPYPIMSTSPEAMLWAGSVGVFSMGIQNTVVREQLRGMATTTMMTGNLTQLASDSIRWLISRYLRRSDEMGATLPETQQRITKYGSTLLAFIGGAACGAFFTELIGFWGVGLTALTIAGLAIVSHRPRYSSSR